VLAYSRVDVTTSNETACMVSPNIPCATRITGGATYLIDVSSRRRRRVLPPARALATDGTRLAAAYARRVVVASRGSSLTLPIRGAIALALDGRRLAALRPAARGLDTISLWDLRRRRRLRQMTVGGVSFPKLGLVGSLAVVGSPAHLVLVDLGGGRQRLVRVSGTREIVDFSVDGRRLVWAEKRLTVPEGVIRSLELGFEPTP
jgi:hypothetical protein